MLFVWILISGLLQSALQPNINFLVLFAIFAGLKKGPIWGLAIGVFIGAIAEVLSHSSPGINLVLYSGIALVAGIVKEKIFYKEGALTAFLFSFFGLVIFYLSYYALTKSIAREVFFTIIFSSAVSPILFRLIE